MREVNIEAEKPYNTTKDQIDEQVNDIGKGNTNERTASQGK